MESEVNAEFLFDLKKTGNKSVIEWCMNVGLIASVYKCYKCGRRMILSERKDNPDGFEWRCRTYGVNGHEVKRSVRKGSWFSESKLSIIEILLVTYYWINKLSNKFIVKDLKLNKDIVIDWNNFCREICLEICVNESSVLGGMGVIVEIHQSKIGNRKMIKRKSAIGNWVLGGVEKSTNKLFFRIVDKINKEILLDIIKTYILPGTTIVSDCWKTYDCYNDEEFLEFIKSQSFNLKDPDIIHHHQQQQQQQPPTPPPPPPPQQQQQQQQQQNIKHYWGIVENQLSRNYGNDNNFDTYLAEIIWRRSHNDQETLECFLEALLKVYPPRKED